VKRLDNLARRDVDEYIQQLEQESRRRAATLDEGDIEPDQRLNEAAGSITGNDRLTGGQQNASSTDEQQQQQLMTSSDSFQDDDDNNNRHQQQQLQQEQREQYGAHDSPTQLETVPTMRGDADAVRPETDETGDQEQSENTTLQQKEVELRHCTSVTEKHHQQKVEEAMQGQEQLGAGDCVPHTETHEKEQPALETRCEEPNVELDVCGPVTETDDQEEQSEEMEQEHEHVSESEQSRTRSDEEQPRVETEARQEGDDEVTAEDTGVDSDDESKNSAAAATDHSRTTRTEDA